MKKFLKGLKNILIGTFITFYFCFLILISIILLNKNDYEITEIGNKTIIVIDDKISNDRYKNGDLVILEKKEINELNIGEEVFIYKNNNNDNSSNILISNIEEKESSYITIKNDASIYQKESIIGVKYSIYNEVGKFLSFIETKWGFFLFLLIPCFFILLYVIYLLFFATNSNKSKKLEEKEDDNSKGKLEIITEDKYHNIEKKIKEFKENSNTEISEFVEEDNEKIDDLMQQISELRKEYDEQNTFTQEIPILNVNEEIILKNVETTEKKIKKEETKKENKQKESKNAEKTKKQKKTYQNNNKSKNIKNNKQNKNTKSNEQNKKVKKSNKKSR